MVFSQLSEEVVRQIVEKMLNEIKERLLKMDYNITFNSSVIEEISKNDYTREYGARPIKRAIQTKVMDFLSESILSGDIKKHEFYTLFCVNGEMTLWPKKVKI